MRWKLIIPTFVITSLICLGFEFAVFKLMLGSPVKSICDPSPYRFLKYHLVLAITLILPFVAGFFVYRHTSKRRKLQAVLIIILSGVPPVIWHFLYMMSELGSVAVKCESSQIYF